MRRIRKETYRGPWTSCQPVDEDKYTIIRMYDLNTWCYIDYELSQNKNEEMIGKFKKLFPYSDLLYKKINDKKYAIQLTTRIRIHDPSINMDNLYVQYDYTQPHQDYFNAVLNDCLIKINHDY